MIAKFVTIAGLSLTVFAVAACTGKTSVATPSTPTESVAPAAATTPVQINQSLSIVIPQGYHLRDGGTMPGTDIRLYQIDADTSDITQKLDQYLLTVFPSDSELPFGFGTSSPDAVLKTIKKNLSEGRYDIQDSTISSTADGSVIRIRAMRPSENELAQIYYLLRNDHSLISLAGGGSVSRVPATQQIDVFTQLVASLTNK